MEQEEHDIYNMIRIKISSQYLLHRLSSLFIEKNSNYYLNTMGMCLKIEILFVGQFSSTTKTVKVKNIK